jgi:hypothetical protein
LQIHPRPGWLQGLGEHQPRGHELDQVGGPGVPAVLAVAHRTPAGPSVAGAAHGHGIVRRVPARRIRGQPQRRRPRVLPAPPSGATPATPTPCPK